MNDKFKYSVITYIFGYNDILRDVPYDENIEYICVTNRKDLHSNSWRVVVDESLNGWDNTLASFYVRHHPFKYCSCNVCLRVDSTIDIQRQPSSILEEFSNTENDVCVMTNSRAKNITLEMLMWVSPCYRDIMKSQRVLYKNLGINISDYGCLQSPFSIIRKNNVCKVWDETCWDIISGTSTDEVTMRPSQVAMTVATELTKDLKVMFVDEYLIQSNFFRWCQHSNNKSRKSPNIIKHTKFFGKPILIHQFNGVRCIND